MASSPGLGQPTLKTPRIVRQGAINVQSTPTARYIRGSLGSARALQPPRGVSPVIPRVALFEAMQFNWASTPSPPRSSLVIESISVVGTASLGIPSSSRARGTPMDLLRSPDFAAQERESGLAIAAVQDDATALAGYGKISLEPCGLHRRQLARHCLGVQVPDGRIGGAPRWRRREPSRRRVRVCCPTTLSCRARQGPRPCLPGGNALGRVGSRRPDGLLADMHDNCYLSRRPRGATR